jgi:hypothetical protein
LEVRFGQPCIPLEQKKTGGQCCSQTHEKQRQAVAKAALLFASAGTLGGIEIKIHTLS